MSEYPINCKRCNKPMGYVHATRWSEKYVCEECHAEGIRGTFPREKPKKEVKND